MKKKIYNDKHAVPCHFYDSFSNVKFLNINVIYFSDLRDVSLDGATFGPRSKIVYPRNTCYSLDESKNFCSI